MVVARATTDNDEIEKNESFVIHILLALQRQSLILVYRQDIIVYMYCLPHNSICQTIISCVY